MIPKGRRLFGGGPPAAGLVALLLLALAGWALPASAQESGMDYYQQRQFDERYRRSRMRFEQPPPVVRRTRRSEAGTAPPAVEAPAAVEKLPDARVVLVVGDFMAAGLAEGLREVYAAAPGVSVTDGTKGSSGLVRDDFYDWPKEIGPLIEASHPAVVVVMIGSNDRQQLRVGETREQPLSPAWTQEYGQRLAAFLEAIAARKVPLVWVGQPAFRFTSMSSDMLAFNDLYRQAVAKAGGEFVDIWDGFVDEGGAFVLTGPDINGQPVRLRAGDGINLTRAGKRKVAFYAEKPLNRLLGDALSRGADGTGLSDVPLPGGAAPAASVDRTAPVSLSAPRPGDGGELLGAVPAPRGKGGTPIEQLTGKGIAAPASPGRADDFGPAAR